MAEENQDKLQVISTDCRLNPDHQEDNQEDSFETSFDGRKNSVEDIELQKKKAMKERVKYLWKKTVSASRIMARINRLQKEIQLYGVTKQHYSERKDQEYEKELKSIK